MLWSLLPAKLFICRAFVIIFKVLKIKWFNLKKKKKKLMNMKVGIVGRKEGGGLH